MIVADLHVHTTASDGTITLLEAHEAARAAGLEAIAITDHDRLHPALDAPLSRFDSGAEPVSDGNADASVDANASADADADDGPTVIRGIELRVDAGFGSLDLLGYAARRTPALTRELDRLGRDRAERGRRIVRRVEDRLGVELDVAIDESVGRPHVARAIAESNAEYGYRGAFAHLIGEDCPCYVPRDLPTVERGVSLLSGACEVVSLAHPFRYRDSERALGLCGDLDIGAVERYYPYDRSVDEALLDQAINEHALLATGGSDAHDDELGWAGLSAERYEPFEERLSGP
jgi:predicted metal-dependent phosphoesterase TrpH